MIQERYATWGFDSRDNRCLVAIQFDKEALEANVILIPEKSLEKSAADQFFTTWLEGNEVPVPESAQHEKRSLSEESILPEEIKVKDTGVIRRLQNEWAYFILSSKLWKSFTDELDQLKEKAAGLEGYDRQLFDQCRTFWERLLNQKKERNLTQAKLDEFKGELNAIFDQLKGLRKKHLEDLDQKTKEQRDAMNVKIQALQAKIKSEDFQFKDAFQDLKVLQGNLKEMDLRKALRQEFQAALSEVYHTIIAKKTDHEGNRVQRRIDGLTGAQEKMERSIDRDRRELEFQNRRTDSVRVTQLEMQLRQSKIRLLQDSLQSKEEKLDSIRKTLEQLKKKSKK